MDADDYNNSNIIPFPKVLRCFPSLYISVLYFSTEAPPPYYPQAQVQQQQQSVSYYHNNIHLDACVLNITTLAVSG